MSIMLEREVAALQLDPVMVETGRQLVDWIEATSTTRWIGTRALGEHRYLLIEDQKRETETKSTLIVLSENREWVALGRASVQAMQNFDMSPASDEHFVNLLLDVDIVEEHSKQREQQEAKDAELRLWNQGCSDFIAGRDSEAARYYLASGVH